MVTKVVTSNDVDNETIVINKNNKLESPRSKDTGLVPLVTTTNVETGATSDPFPEL